jgi:hypothetical protein
MQVQRKELAPSLKNVPEFGTFNVAVFGNLWQYAFSVQV